MRTKVELVFLLFLKPNLPPTQPEGFCVNYFINFFPLCNFPSSLSSSLIFMLKTREQLNQPHLSYVHSIFMNFSPTLIFRLHPMAGKSMIFLIKGNVSFFLISLKNLTSNRSGKVSHIVVDELDKGTMRQRNFATFNL